MFQSPDNCLGLTMDEQDDISADTAIPFRIRQAKNPQLDRNEQGFIVTRYDMKQYVMNVSEYSSQYGSDYSISYTTHGLIGRPNKFPLYGDFPECFAMRTYGRWWDMAPSRITPIQPQNFSPVEAEDFVVVEFENYMFPDKISIFETFNPGSVVRIWACTLYMEWEMMWEAESLELGIPVGTPCSREFSPPLKKLSAPTKVLRIEFNHKHLNYFAEIDGILLVGKTTHLPGASMRISSHGPIARRLRDMQFDPCETSSDRNKADILKSELEKFTALNSKNSSLELNKNVIERDGDKEHASTLTDMPVDILLYIMKFLDLKSLFRVGRVSRVLYETSTHPLLYKEINLKPYWYLVKTALLQTIAQRAQHLKKLDMSWCGSRSNNICTTEFKKFIHQRGENLTHLYLNDCSFLNYSCMDTFGISCENLKELSLRNCKQIMASFTCLTNLRNLERLDLCECGLDTDLLSRVIQSNRKLKHLNIAYSYVDVSMDSIALYLSKYTPDLISIDMWKSHGLTASGLRSLSNCTKLEEVDFGWCVREAALGDSLRTLITSCPKLKKVFLATVRGITELDVQCIANNCPNLEQLDLMGSMGISRERYFEILQKCKKLKLFDLSFCDNIDINQANIWAWTFDVEIKCSHIPEDGRLDLDF